MNSKLLAFIVGLLTATSPAWADGGIVRWDRVEGFGAADTSAIMVGQFNAARGRTVGSGRVIVNLNNGFLSFRIDGLSNGKQYSNGPLGAPWTAGEMLVGTVVCDSTQRFGAFAYADSTPIAFDANGDGAFNGFLQLPAGCRERPEEMAFLLRHYGGGPSGFVAYGAGRSIR
jgi:hypothetical protein